MENSATILNVPASHQLITTRVLDFDRALVFRAYAEPEHLKNWWGPKGFTNTFHEHNFQEGAKWKFTMHGPDGKDYFNEWQYVLIEEPSRIVLNHLTDHFFQSQVNLEEVLPTQTRITWAMVFETEEQCERIKAFVQDKNEENIDRLEAELKKMQ